MPVSSCRRSRTTAAPARLAQERADRLQREQLARRNARKLSLEEVFSRAQAGDIKELNIVLKADVAGSLEALQDELAKVPQERVAINIIHSQAGGIDESDVMLASASEAIIIGFNVRPLADARRAANREGVDVRTYSVIYKITEDLRNAMEGLLDAIDVEETLGEVVVKETFKASKVGRIAGCQVAEGKAVRSASVRLLRDGTVVWTGKLASLRRFKDDVAEVDEGQECGIVLDGYADVKEGDVFFFVQTKQVEQTLELGVQWQALACGASTSNCARSSCGVNSPDPPLMDRIRHGDRRRDQSRPAHGQGLRERSGRLDGTRRYAGGLALLARGDPDADRRRDADEAHADLDLSSTTTRSRRECGSRTCSTTARKRTSRERVTTAAAPPTAVASTAPRPTSSGWSPSCARTTASC